MSDVCSSDLSELSIEVFVGSLKGGLTSINRVYDALICGKSTNYDYIREQIVQAKQSLEQSEQEAKKGLECLDKNTEILTQYETNLDREVRAKQQTLDNLRTEQKSKETLLKQSKVALEEARSALSSATETLRAQEERKRNAEILTGAGAGVYFIPHYGWIVGLGMMIGGGVEISQASYAVTEAEEKVKRSESEVEIFERECSEYKSKISQTERDIGQTKDQIQKISEGIQKVKEQRAAVAEFQEKVRKAVHMLSNLSGKARVVENQTRRFILQEPVMKVMEEVMKAAKEIAGTELLSDEGIPRLLDEIRENDKKLAAICASISC